MNSTSDASNRVQAGIDPFAQRARLVARLGGNSAEALFVPGRIEVLGKHTDYCGGRSLLCAVERGIYLAWTPRSDAVVSIEDLVLQEKVELPATAAANATQGHWANYPATVIRRLTSNFGGPLQGADVILASDLPQAAGLSSSSAMITGFTLLLARVNGLARTPPWQAAIQTQADLATYLGAIESGRRFRDLSGDRGVGTLGGSEDHTAILFGKPGALLQFSFCPVRFEQEIAMPEGHTFVVASSGVVAEKTGAAMAKYNQVSMRVAIILELWNIATGRSDPYLADALDSHPAAVDDLRTILLGRKPEFDNCDLEERLEQHLTESRSIIPQASAALAKSDLTAFGILVRQSQRLAETLLHNQVPETSFLASSACDLGAAAASAFGAGFGGAVWALVRREAAAEFTSRWQRQYVERFPDCTPRSVFFITEPGPSASWLFPDRQEAVNVSI